MNLLKRLLKWLDLDAKPSKYPSHTPPPPPFIPRDTCQTYPEYNEMQTQLNHAREWRQSGNTSQELRTLSNLWRTLLDRQNLIRKEQEPVRDYKPPVIEVLKSAINTIQESQPQPQTTEP